METDYRFVYSLRMNRAAVTILPFILVFLSSCVNDYGNQEHPPAVAGTLDLRDWSLEEDGPVPLSGQWEFYWQRLYGPDHFEDSVSDDVTPTARPRSDVSGGGTSRSALFADVPGSWESVELDGGGIPGTGYATYRLIVLLGDQPERLAIRTLTVSTAFALYVNGVQANSAGNVGVDSQASEPEYNPQVQHIPDGGNPRRLELLVQVSNFDYRTGGLWRPLRLGTEEDLSVEKWNRDLRSMFLFGTLFMISMYHFALFLMRRKDTYFLHLALLSLLISVRALVVGEYILTGLMSDVSFSTLIRTEYISYFLAVVAAVLLFRSMFPKDFLRWVPHLVTVITGLFVAFVLLTPPALFTQVIFLHHAFSFCVIAYLAFVCGYAVKRGRPGAVLALVGFVIMAVASVHDILYSSFVIPTGNIADAALIIFIFVQAVVLSLRLTDAFSQVETLTGELAALNAGLERQVDERTAELRSAYESIKVLSVLDPLTKCYNRYFLDDHLPAEIARALRYERALSVVMCDIDHFKEINDTYGHLAGDEVLVSVAERITETLRDKVDWVCRYGGEEFVVVIAETVPEHAVLVAERMRARITDLPIATAEHTVAVTASFGVAGITGKPLNSESIMDDLLGSADRMLYRAKFNGRNSVVSDIPLEAFEG
ncbi:MAG: diguanylate cyclase [bacterium]